MTVQGNGFEGKVREREVSGMIPRFLAMPQER